MMQTLTETTAIAICEMIAILVKEGYTIEISCDPSGLYSIRVLGYNWQTLAQDSLLIDALSAAYQVTPEPEAATQAAEAHVMETEE